MKVTYTASSYAPERVTGRYIRHEFKSEGFRFKVFETATGTAGNFLGKPGMGGTLREYLTDTVPAEVAELCRDGHTHKWPL